MGATTLDELTVLLEQRSRRPSGLPEDFEMRNCSPYYTNGLKKSLEESFLKIKAFYESEGQSLLASPEGKVFYMFLQNFLAPYEQGKGFECRAYFFSLREQFGDFFSAVHRGTIDHMGETERDRQYDRIFDLLRFEPGSRIKLHLDSLEVWHHRTQLWQEKYSKQLH